MIKKIIYTAFIYITIGFCNCTVNTGKAHKVVTDTGDVKDAHGYYLLIKIKPTIIKQKLGFFFSRIQYGAPHFIGIAYQQPTRLFKELLIDSFLIKNENDSIIYNLPISSKVEMLSTNIKKQYHVFECEHKLDKNNKKLKIFVDLSLIDTMGNDQKRNYYFETKLKKEREFRFLVFN